MTTPHQIAQAYRTLAEAASDPLTEAERQGLAEATAQGGAGTWRRSFLADSTLGVIEALNMGGMAIMINMTLQVATHPRSGQLLVAQDGGPVGIIDPAGPAGDRHHHAGEGASAAQGAGGILPGLYPGRMNEARLVLGMEVPATPDEGCDEA